jgi:hypothetical protein
LTVVDRWLAAQDGPVLDREGVPRSTTVADPLAVGWLELIGGISELTGQHGKVAAGQNCRLRWLALGR